MKIVRKLTALLAAIIIAAASISLFSCAKESGDDTTAAPETEAPVINVDIVMDGKSLYKIIRPENAEQATIDDAVKLKKAISEATGVNVPIDTDWLKRGTEPDPSVKEILVGDTNRPETQEILKTLKYGEYAVMSVGNKIVVAAHTDSGINKAVNYFIKYYLSGDPLSLYTDGIYNLSVPSDKFYVSHSDYALESYTLGGVEANTYTIVVPEKGRPSDTVMANQIQTKIAIKYGYVLSIVTDAEAENANEILVGATNRAASKKYFDPGVQLLYYTIEQTGGKLVFAAGSRRAANFAITAFEDEFLSSSGKTLAVPDKKKVEKDLSSLASPERAEGTDLRIMSSNVLFDKVDIPERAEMLAETYLLYMPDSLGLQEMIPEWQSALFPMISEYYTSVEATLDGNPNYTQIVYLKDKYELVESGFHRYRSSYNPWSVLYAVLKDKTTGRIYIHCNTHFTIVPTTSATEQNSVEGVKYRMNDSTYLRELVHTLMNKYPDCAVFCTGDFNCYRGTAEFANLISDGNLNSAMFMIEGYPRVNYNTSHGLGEELSKVNQHAIDHVFMTTSLAKPLYHDILYNETLADASDHCPVYADIQLIGNAAAK